MQENSRNCEEIWRAFKSGPEDGSEQVLVRSVVRHSKTCCER